MHPPIRLGAAEIYFCGLRDVKYLPLSYAIGFRSIPLTVWPCSPNEFFDFFFKSAPPPLAPPLLLPVPSRLYKSGAQTKNFQREIFLEKTFWDIKFELIFNSFYSFCVLALKLNVPKNSIFSENVRGIDLKPIGGSQGRLT